MPFIDSVDKANECVQRIEEHTLKDGTRPIIISTLVRPDVAGIFATTNGVVLDFFGAFIAPMEAELGQKSSHTIGRSHGCATSKDYLARIDAVNFTLAHDDGVTDRDLDQADVILVGVAQRQNPNEPLPRFAVRHQGGKFPTDTRRLRTQSFAGQSPLPSAQAVWSDHISRSSVPNPPGSGGPTVAMPRGITAGGKWSRPKS